MRSDHFHVFFTTLGAAGLILFAGTAWAATLYVDGANPSCDNTAGAPYCSLQAAINAASSGDTIMVSNGIYAGEIVVNKPLTIQGSGNTRLSGSSDQRAVFVQAGHAVTLRNVIIVNGDKDIGGGILNEGNLTIVDSTLVSNAADGYLTHTVGRGGAIYNAATVTLQRCSVAHNQAFGDYNSGLAAYGGAIYCTADATLVISNSAIYANKAEGSCNYNLRTGDDGFGGGIYSDGYSLLVNSTIASNMARGASGYYDGGAAYGGGICNQGVLDVWNCTIAQNDAHAGSCAGGCSYPGQGGGIYSPSRSVTLCNTILARNLATTAGADCYGVINSLGYNLVEANSTITNVTSSVITGTDPSLAPLGLYGGTIPVFMLRLDSPALDRGGSGGPSADSRGSPRPLNLSGVADADNGSDIGAVEFDNRDTDTDGMFNDWEIQYGLNPTNSSDALHDPDGDSLNNVAEFQNMTDPGNPDTDSDTILDGEEVIAGADGFMTSPRLADSDGDGTKDNWEIQYSFNPTNPADAAQDADADSLTNLQEFNAGSNPRNADTDGDTLIDGWEFVFGHNLTNAAGMISGDRLNLVRIWKDASYGLYEGVSGVEVRGDFAYLAASKGFQIVDIADPAEPVLRGNYAITNGASDLDVQSNRAYVVNGADGLMVFDVTSPTNPQLLGQVSITSGASYIRVAWPTAYVISWEQDLQIVNISNPANPVVVASFFVASSPGYSHSFSYVHAVDVVGHLAYLGCQQYTTNDYAFRILDVSQPTNPVEIARYHTTNAVERVHITSDHAYLSTYGGLHIYDVTVPTNARQVGYYAPSSAGPIVSLSNRVFVTSYSAWDIVDARVDSAPLVAAHKNVTDFGLGSGLDDTAVRGAYLFTAHSYTGLVVLRYVPYDGDEDGMDDQWEMTNFGTTTNDAGGDVDGDGISNWGEFLNNLSPTNTDQDGDGITDGWENQHLLNPTNNDVAADSDADGALDVHEFIADTDPQNSSSRFLLDVEPRETEDTVLLSVPSSAARRYLMQYSTNLLTGTWRDVAPETAGNGGVLSVSWSNTLPGVYYRAKVRKP